ncbi:hypothetical protein D3C86_1467890 [compost metagenome]
MIVGAFGIVTIGREQLVYLCQVAGFSIFCRSFYGHFHIFRFVEHIASHAYSCNVPGTVVVDLVKGFFTIYCKEFKDGLKEASGNGFSVFSRDGIINHVVTLYGIHLPYKIIKALPEDLAGLVVFFSFGMQGPFAVICCIFQQDIFNIHGIFLIAGDLVSDAAV